MLSCRLSEKTFPASDLSATHHCTETGCGRFRVLSGIRLPAVIVLRLTEKYFQCKHIVSSEVTDWQRWWELPQGMHCFCFLSLLLCGTALLLNHMFTPQCCDVSTNGLSGFWTDVCIAVADGKKKIMWRIGWDILTQSDKKSIQKVFLQNK